MDIWTEGAQSSSQGEKILYLTNQTIKFQGIPYSMSHILAQMLPNNFMKVNQKFI